MSTDWKAGDRALCVEKFEGTASFPGGPTIPIFEAMPKLGTVYLVDGVEMGHKELCLHLVGLSFDRSMYHGYIATKFRKIVPACDRAVIEQEAKA